VRQKILDAAQRLGYDGNPPEGKPGHPPLNGAAPVRLTSRRQERILLAAVTGPSQVFEEWWRCGLGRRFLVQQSRCGKWQD